MLKLSREIYWKNGETSCAEEFKHMRALGYKAADYQILANAPGEGVYAMPDSLFERLLKEDAAAAKDAGIYIGQTHGVWPYDDRIPEQAELKFEATVKGIIGTALVGAPYIVIHPVLPTMWSPSEHHEADKEANIEFLRRVLPYAHQYGVKLALENMPNKYVPCGHTSELVECIDIINDDHLVACLDTGHCAAVGDDAGDMVRLLGKRLAALHIHDSRPNMDLHLIPYYGVTDWDSFKAALQEIGYSGTLSMETDAPRCMPEPFRSQTEQIAFQLLSRLNF